MSTMRKSIIQSVIVMSSVLGCSDSFTFANNDREDAKPQRTNEGGYRPNPFNHVTEREKDATPESQRDTGVTIPESSVDAGSDSNEPISVQDSGRPEAQVKEAQAPITKPWWETNPEGTCVSGNPKQCASGCSCVHLGKAWCCI